VGKKIKGKKRHLLVDIYIRTLHRVRERLVGQRTGIINQIRAFLLDRGVAVRPDATLLRAELPVILVKALTSYHTHAILGL
jgi:transposase